MKTSYLGLSLREPLAYENLEDRCEWDVNLNFQAIDEAVQGIDQRLTAVEAASGANGLIDAGTF